MTRSKDLLAQFGGEAVKAPEPGFGKQPYRAFEVTPGEKRYLEIRPRFPNPAECPSYSLLNHIRAEWRMGVAVTLEFGHGQPGMKMMAIIRGENLMELYRALKEWRVNWIAEFDPQEHETPTDEGAPFIREITIHTTRPEESPPVEKRH